MAVGSSRPADAAQVHQAVRASAQALERDIEDVADDLVGVLHQDIPELPSDARSQVATRRAAIESIHGLMRTVLRGAPVEATESPPTPVLSARAMARAGLGTRPVLRIIHVTHRVVLAAWEQRLADLELPSEVLLAAVQSCQAVSFEWSDVVTTRLVAEYQEEHDRLARSGEAQRARTIRALLDGEPHDPDALSRALGYELGRHHTALVLWTGEDGKDRGAALERAAAEVAGAIGAGKPLILPVSGAVIWAWLGTHGSPTTALDALARRRTDRVSVAIGEPAFGPAGFRASHRDADDAFRLAQLGGRRQGTVTRYPDVQLAATFAADLERARRFVRTQLGELAADDEESLRLRATLKVFLDEHGSRQATASRLGIHANTVGNRIRTCQELVGHSVDRRPLELHVALSLAERLGSAVLR